jgi:hypothetical protein
VTGLIESVWDWRFSGHVRFVSLGGTWFVLVMPHGPSWLLIALAVTRLGATPLQLALNRRLGRRHPLASRDRYDWALFLLLMAAVLALPNASRATGLSEESFVLVVPLLPYSGLQLRQCRRSYRAHLDLAYPPTLA